MCKIIYQKKKLINKISLDIFKKIILLLLKQTLAGKIKLCYKKSAIINQLFLKKILYIYQGYMFKRLRIFYFYLGYKFGNFIFTKKPNVHISFKKLKLHKKKKR